MGNVYFYCRRNEQDNKLVCKVDDLIYNTKELEKNQVASIINQLSIKHKNSITLNMTEKEVFTPSIKTIHPQLKSIANKCSPLFK